MNASERALHRAWDSLRRSNLFSFGWALRNYVHVVDADERFKARAESLRSFALANQHVYRAASEKRAAPSFDSGRHREAFGFLMLEESRQFQEKQLFGRITHSAETIVGERGRGQRDHHADLIDMTMRLLEPFHEFLLDGSRLEASVPLAVRRYADWVQWFRRAELRALIDAEEDRVAADGGKRQFEKELQRPLWEWLFQQDFRVTIREPDTPAGEPDFLIGEVDSELVPIEVKVLRDDNSAAPSEGREQLEIYMEHFSAAPFGILVLFDLTSDGRRLALGETEGAFPVVRFGNRCLYVFVIDVGPRSSASVRARTAGAQRLTSESFA